jgi:hypothetical protein
MILKLYSAFSAKLSIKNQDTMKFCKGIQMFFKYTIYEPIFRNQLVSWVTRNRRLTAKKKKKEGNA